MPAAIVAALAGAAAATRSRSTSSAAAPAHGVAQAIFPVAAGAEAHAAARAAGAAASSRTRSSSPAPSTAPTALAEWLDKRGIAVERIHGNRSQGQRTEALAGFKNGQVPDPGRHRHRGARHRRRGAAARGELRRARRSPTTTSIASAAPRAPSATGDAWTFASPAEEGDLRAIERAVGKPLERATLDGFDYGQRTAESLEVPLKERIAEIRARKAEERKRAAANAARKAENQRRDSDRGPRPKAKPQGRPHSQPSRPSGRPGSRSAAAHRPHAQPAQPSHHAGHGTERASHRPAGPTHVPWWLRKDA